MGAAYLPSSLSTLSTATRLSRPVRTAGFDEWVYYAAAAPAIADATPGLAFLTGSPCSGSARLDFTAPGAHGGLPMH